jgi:hypothetical protein
MRTLERVDIDPNCVKIEIKEDGKLLVQDTFPTRWAFENNSLTQLNGLLSAAGKSQLTEEEISQLHTWINEG